MHKDITICLSGGIDSAISAYLLKRQGYKVKGVYMKNWATPVTRDAIPKIKSNFDLSCTFHKDYLYAQNVAEFLEIDLKLVDLQKQYWQRVFQPFLDGLEKNATPNPDIFCNKYIKFDELRSHIDTEWMATGHYCRVQHNQLMRGMDHWKDQSYFLCQVKHLNHCIFPIGHLLKLQVKWLAYNIATSKANSYSAYVNGDIGKEDNIFKALLNKKESMGICFIGKQDFGTFVNDYVPERSGFIIDLNTNTKLKTHNGSHFYTIGQGVGLPGRPYKLYVVHKQGNDIFVGPYNHPLLYSKSIDVSSMIWYKKHLPRKLMAKVRHPSKLVPCTLSNKVILFDEPVRGLTPGQVICLYDGDYVVGSMEIPLNWNKNAFHLFMDTCNGSSD